MSAFSVILTAPHSLGGSKNQQPRLEGTGYVGSDRYGLYVCLIPIYTKHEQLKTALKGGVSNLLANEEKYKGNDSRL